MGLSQSVTAKRRGAFPDRFSLCASVSSVVKNLWRILSSKYPLYLPLPFDNVIAKPQNAVYNHQARVKQTLYNEFQEQC